MLSNVARDNHQPFLENVTLVMQPNKKVRPVPRPPKMSLKKKNRRKEDTPQPKTGKESSQKVIFTTKSKAGWCKSGRKEKLTLTPGSFPTGRISSHGGIKVG